MKTRTIKTEIMEHTFQLGQRVSTWDDDDRKRVYGKVLRVLAEKIVVKWEDISEAVEHFKDEWSDIKIEKSWNTK